MSSKQQNKTFQQGVSDMVSSIRAAPHIKISSVTGQSRTKQDGLSFTAQHANNMPSHSDTARNSSSETKISSYRINRVARRFGKLEQLPTSTQFRHYASDQMNGKLSLSQMLGNSQKRISAFSNNCFEISHHLVEIFNHNMKFFNFFFGFSPPLLCI